MRGGLGNDQDADRARTDRRQHDAARGGTVVRNEAGEQLAGTRTGGRDEAAGGVDMGPEEAATQARGGATVAPAADDVPGGAHGARARMGGVARARARGGDAAALRLVAAHPQHLRAGRAGDDRDGPGQDEDDPGQLAQGGAVRPRGDRADGDSVHRVDDAGGTGTPAQERTGRTTRGAVGVHVAGRQLGGVGDGTAQPDAGAGDAGDDGRAAGGGTLPGGGHRDGPSDTGARAATDREPARRRRRGRGRRRGRPGHRRAGALRRKLEHRVGSGVDAREPGGATALRRAHRVPGKAAARDDRDVQGDQPAVAPVLGRGGGRGGEAEKGGRHGRGGDAAAGGTWPAQADAAQGDGRGRGGRGGRGGRSGRGGGDGGGVTQAARARGDMAQPQAGREHAGDHGTEGQPVGHQRAADRGRQEHTVHAAGGDGEDRDEHRGRAVRGADGGSGHARRVDGRRLRPFPIVAARGTGRAAAGRAAGGGQRRHRHHGGVFGLRRRVGVRRLAPADLRGRVSHRHHGRRLPGAAGGAQELAPVPLPARAVDGDDAGGARGLVPGADAGGGSGGGGAGPDDEGQLPVPGGAGRVRGRGGGAAGGRDGQAAGGDDVRDAEGRDLLPLEAPMRGRGRRGRLRLPPQRDGREGLPEGAVGVGRGPGTPVDRSHVRVGDGDRHRGHRGDHPRGTAVRARGLRAADGARRTAGRRGGGVDHRARRTRRPGGPARELRGRAQPGGDGGVRFDGGMSADGGERSHGRGQRRVVRGHSGRGAVRSMRGARADRQQQRKERRRRARRGRTRRTRGAVDRVRQGRRATDPDAVPLAGRGGGRVRGVPRPAALPEARDGGDSRRAPAPAARRVVQDGGGQELRGGTEEGQVRVAVQLLPVQAPAGLVRGDEGRRAGGRGRRLPIHGQGAAGGSDGAAEPEGRGTGQETVRTGDGGGGGGISPVARGTAAVPRNGGDEHACAVGGDRMGSIQRGGGLVRDVELFARAGAEAGR
ncbi:hypothetical protein CMEL01_16813 [Colletotrichum melonis]|uniref:Uncharacterized protein n=1 Tax=Colletotrichum melonis TaxID=1209925 RepID=A0AAI9XED2_9PEZI|nr:hypothetical protein CMEL01_16813 [Colletotrichum melonis]